MKCKFCNTIVKKPAFDIGNTAISNDLISKDKLSSVEKIYPLVFYVCPQCTLAQVDQYKKGYEIFDDDYVYFSSYSSYWLEHARKYVENICTRLNLGEQSFVVEVASNDGYLLSNFVEKNIQCLGVEPTKSTAQEAIKKGVPTIIDFFNLKLANRLKKEKKADLIVANNVLAHVPDINNFVHSLKVLLNKEGVITIEFPHVLELIEKNEFDTIYHEHFFYFSILSLVKIFEKYNLSIFDVDELETHGGSLRIYLSHINSNVCKNSSKENINKVLSKELNYGLDSLKYYEKLQHKAQDIKLNSLNYLINNKMNGKKIIAFGAAAKGNTFMNYCGIKPDIIEAVIDETPYKIGKYMPQSKIPILPLSSIVELKPEIIVILPWNHRNEILEKLRFTKEWNCEIVVFIPKFEKLQ